MDQNKLIQKFKYLKASNSLVIILFGIFLIINSFHSIFNYGYGLDDYYLISRSFKEAFLKNFEIGGVHFRPIWYLSYPLVNVISNASSFHHFINIFLHFVNCILVYFLTRKFIGNIVPLLVITIWSILPWCVIPYIWLAQRNDLLMGFFILLTLLFSNKSDKRFAYLSTILAYLSKSTCLFFPLAYTSNSLLKRKKSDLLFGIFSFIVFFLIAIVMYKNGLAGPLGNVQIETNSLPTFIKVANFFKNFVLSWFLLFLPIPFFTSFSQGIIWLSVSITLLLVLIKYGKFSQDSKYFLFLALLMSITSTITADIRITYMQTLFLIIAYFIALKDIFLKEKKYGNEKILIDKSINIQYGVILFSISIIFILSSFSNQFTAYNFKTKIYNLQSSKDHEHCIHVNNFYEWNRAFQKKILKKGNNLPEFKLCD